MLHQISFDSIRETVIKDPSAKIYVVSKNPQKLVNDPQINLCSSLAPSTKLSQGLKLGYIQECEYQKKYSDELRSPVAQVIMGFINNEALLHEIYLVTEVNDGLLLNVMINIKKAPSIKEFEWQT